MRFLLDSMLPPRAVELLRSAGHDAQTPTELGAHNLDDDQLIEICTQEDRVIVTENAVDFAAVISCPVLLVRKSWWASETLSTRLAASVPRWATANPEPGPWAHWLLADLR